MYASDREMDLIEEIAEQAKELIEEEKRNTHYKDWYYLDEALHQIDKVVNRVWRGRLTVDEASCDIEEIIRKAF